MAKNCIVRPLLLLLAVSLSLVATGLSADDGWRRTAQGWEQKSAWQTKFSRQTSSPGGGHFTALQSQAALQPVVVHPGQVALLQVAGSCLVLSLFAPTRLRTKTSH